MTPIWESSDDVRIAGAQARLQKERVETRADGHREEPLLRLV
jgi:hypothetical protein